MNNIRCTDPRCDWSGNISECVGGGVLPNSDEYDDYYCPECYANYCMTLVKRVKEVSV